MASGPKPKGTNPEGTKETSLALQCGAGFRVQGPRLRAWGSGFRFH